MNKEQLRNELERMAAPLLESEDREVMATGVVLHTLSAALVAGDATQWAGMAAGYCQAKLDEMARAEQAESARLN